ncbi:hypothetical protein [Devosia sp.]|uniref:hypothetical protein n=1 Tax=Devosia sp. TaxID=1871048 RepID=UPI003A90922A
MATLRTFLLAIVALFALLTPSLATGVCVASGVPQVSVASDSAHLPTPCEVQGGKRIAAQSQQVAAPRPVELPNAVALLWAAGLRDDPALDGRTPGTETPPPRLG